MRSEAVLWVGTEAETGPGRQKLTQLWGEDSLWERLNGLEYKVSPLSFFQTNVHQTETLYRVVADAAGADPFSPYQCMFYAYYAFPFLL